MEKDSHKRYVHRNFAVSTLLHVGLIGCALFLSAFVPTSPERPVWVELGDGQTPGSGGIVFWGILAVVVVGLLVVITRLLPKAQTPPPS